MSKQNQDEQVQDGCLLTYYHMTYLQYVCMCMTIFFFILRYNLDA